MCLPIIRLCLNIDFDKDMMFRNTDFMEPNMFSKQKINIHAQNKHYCNSSKDSQQNAFIFTLCYT